MCRVVHYCHGDTLMRTHPFLVYRNTRCISYNRTSSHRVTITRIGGAGLSHTFRDLVCQSTDSLVPYLYAGSTVYAAAVTALFLYLGTRALWVDGQSEGQDVVFLYSSDELKKSRGQGRRLLSPSMGYMASPRMLFRLLIPLILVYAILLVRSYEPDMLQLILPGSLKEGLSSGFNPQFFPTITGIATLFSRTATTASLWVHVLCVNIFAAHTLLWKGVRIGIPTHHTVILSMIFGPLGFVSHWMTSHLAQVFQH